MLLHTMVSRKSVYKSPDTWGLENTTTVRTQLYLVVVTADLLIEAGMTILVGTCPADDSGHTSIAAYAQVEVTLDVSIFWVVNVHVQEQAK
jgi:hypothetical protein